MAYTTQNFKNNPRRIKNKKRAIKIADFLFTGIVYFIIVMVFALPLLYVLSNSMRINSAIWNNAFPVSWKTFIPYEGVTFKNFAQTLGIGVKGVGLGMDISRNLGISLLTAIVVVGSSLIFNTGAAYFFGRLKFPGKKYLLVYVLATMMIPQQVVAIPLYFVVESMGLINTFWALVVPWYASPFVVFLLSQFMSDLPIEYDEAAEIDGASKWQILWRIVLPNVIPGILTVSIMEFQFIWNEFYWPLIAISNKNLYPVQVAISSQFGERTPDWGVVFAAMVLASTPIIVLFLFLQQYFFESVSRSGIKG